MTVLARLGGITLVTYGLLAAVGGAAATLLIVARQLQAGFDLQRYGALLFVAGPLVIAVGSRVLLLVLEWREFAAAPLGSLRRPGFAFQGGFIATTSGVIGVALAHDLPLLTFLDTFVLGLPLGHAVGRLGCHTYGCCHGRPTTSRLAVRYTSPDTKAVWSSGLCGVPLHPTQLYSALGNLVLFAALNALALAPRSPGLFAALYLLVGSAGRFVVELIRGIPVRRTLGLTPFQLVSLALIAVGVGLLLVVVRQPASAALSSELIPALLRAAQRWDYPLLVFGVLFVCFGIHGREVGRPLWRPRREERR